MSIFYLCFKNFLCFVEMMFNCIVKLISSWILQILLRKYVRAWLLASYILVKPQEERWRPFNDKGGKNMHFRKLFSLKKIVYLVLQMATCAVEWRRYDARSNRACQFSQSRPVVHTFKWKQYPKYVDILCEKYWTLLIWF